MKRYRITLSETKRGWEVIVQNWNTCINGGFYGGKDKNVLIQKYADPVSATEAAAGFINELEQC